MRPLNDFDMTLTLFLIDDPGKKLECIVDFIIFLIVMSSDILDLGRTLAGDLWVVQETEQLQRTFHKMIRKMNGLKVLQK